MSRCLAANHGIGFTPVTADRYHSAPDQPGVRQ
jgi:hypothetical protein